MGRRAGPVQRIARGLRRRLRGRGRSGTTEAPIETLAIDPGAPIAAIAEALDIGLRRRTRPPHHGYDVAEDDLGRLLGSAAEHAAARGLGLHVQLPGSALRLTPASVPSTMRAIGRKRPRLRLIVRDADATVENIAVELWHGASRALRPRSLEPPVQLLLGGAPESGRPPHRTDATIDFPIDAVYTWVSSADPRWRALAADHLDLDAIDGDRYGESDELRYSLRSLETFAPWIERIHILSNCDPPAWLRPSDRVRWVDHAEVMDADQRPQFNSGAIDTYLHRIPDLTDHFLYLNDDFLMWDSVTPASFFTWDGRARARLSADSSALYLEQRVDAGSATKSQHSRVNAARLLEARIGIYPNRLHALVPYALRRDTMAAIETEFADEMAATRASRVRSDADVSFTAFLYHHWASARGETIVASSDSAFVTRRNHRRARVRSRLRTAPFACFQDSHGAADDADYQAFKRAALEGALPLSSAAEG